LNFSFWRNFANKSPIKERLILGSSQNQKKSNQIQHKMSSQKLLSILLSSIFNTFQLLSFFANTLLFTWVFFEAAKRHSLGQGGCKAAG
jgi:hypothetical protein